MEHKNVAQKWLTQAQASAQAWHFCWALLSQDKVCPLGVSPVVKKLLKLTLVTPV